MSGAPDSAMIFAAGLGTRMGALTADRPKPLIEVGGRTLLDHALAVAEAARIGRIVVNVHYRADMIRAHLSGRRDILFSDETDKLLDTGGGLRRALPLLGDGPVFTLNSDAAWTGPNAFETLRRAWDAERMDALLLLVPRAQAAGHADPGDFLLDESGRIARGAGLVYTGAQIVNAAAAAAAGEGAFSLNLAWDAFARAGRLFGTVHPGGWCDVGRPESIRVAARCLREAGLV